MPNTRDSDFDKALGARIRLARITAKMSQGTLGGHLGISFQQVRKYELGKDRVSVHRLSGIASALGRSAASFLDDEPGVMPLPVAASRQHVRTATTLDALRPDVRRRVVALIDTLAQPDADLAVSEHCEAA